MAKTAAAPSHQAPTPGQFFDTPGIGGGTQWTEQDESSKGLANTLSQGTQTIVQGILPFKQTDVVFDWALVLVTSQTYAAGGGAFTLSPYAPWNQIGPVALPVQNQYKPVDVESGIDLYIFNMLRPWVDTDMSNLYAAPQGAGVGGVTGYLGALNAQASLTNTAAWTQASTTWATKLRIPACAWFDLYYDLDIMGNPITAPHPAYVSPQYMAGATRIITPTITMNPMIGTGLDQAPTLVTGGAPTAAGTQTIGFRRIANYAGNPALMPPVYGWQYRWKTTRFGIGGKSVADLPVPPETGQLLLIYIRLWDPAGNGGKGAEIPLSAVTRFQLMYGSGLSRFDGTAAAAQQHIIQNHNLLLPPGVLAFDMAQDERGNRTNRRALNVLTTAGVQVHLEFTGAQSASAYAVMGTESLVFVA